MKKISGYVLSILLFAFIIIWIGCFLDKQENRIDNNALLEVLDNSNGSRLSIACTIIVNGSTWDGNGMEIDATSLPPTSKYLAPSPVFSVTNGTVKNVILTGKARQPFTLNGDCTVSDVTIDITSSDTAMFTNKNIGNLSFSNITINYGGGTSFRMKGGTTAVYQNIKSNQFFLISQYDALASTYYLDEIKSTNLHANNIVECQNSADTTVYWRNITAEIPESLWWNGSFQVIPY